MTSLIVAGIDAGQRYLDVSIAPAGTTFRIENKLEAIEQLTAQLSRAGVVRVVLEAIGHYAHVLVEALRRTGFRVDLVNPKRIKAFRDAEGRRAKTDRLDAKLIARFALTMTDTLRELPTADQLALKALSTRRRQLTEMIAMEKTRLKQASQPLIQGSHRATIEALSGERDAIEAEIARRIAADPEQTKTRELLMSVPGIGPRVADVLLTELPEIGQRDRKAIASLVGLAPHVTQSGNAPPRAAISGGRPCVRAAVYMSALSVVRRDARFEAEYDALRAQGKPGKVALIAIARKLLIAANAVVKARKPYEPPLRPKDDPANESAAQTSPSTA